MKMKKEKPSYGGGGKMDMYADGGKTKPMYMFGGKVYADGGSLMEALMKKPEQREKAKKMLGM